MSALRRNPSLIQYMVFNELDKALNVDGNAAVTYDIPDATLPFVYAMECGITETTMAIDEMESTSRMLFPKLAITSDDLYKHMSDDDYIGRFASPSRTVFELLLARDEIIAKSVIVDAAGNSKLTIPRLTEFIIADTPFTMQYPIDIKVSTHGGINITYDMDSVSPIETLTSNILDWSVLIIEGRKILSIKIPVYQMKVNTHTDSLSPSTLFQTSYKFNSYFFYARAYIDSGDGWKEVYTTHSDLVHDPLKVTVVFKVVGNELRVSIPTIYTNLNMVNGNIRIDIYTTLGKLERDLASYKTSQFSFNLNDIDDNKTYVSPLRTFSMAQALARQMVTGGTDSVDFLKIRDRVIDNTLGLAAVPITNVQLEDAVERKGYSLVSNIDNITNRQFLATRKLEQPTNLDLVSGAGIAMSEFSLSMESITGSTHTVDNGDRVTIKPSMLYNFINGRIVPLSDSAIARLNTGSPELIAREANASRYVYSPFYTVLDASDDTFEARPYYLDNPEVTEKVFVGDNPSSYMQATISNYHIEKVDAGFKFYIGLETSEALRKLEDSQIIVQIGYKPLGENRWASGNATFMYRKDNIHVYEFVMETNYDLDRNNLLYTTNMTMFSMAQNRFATTLNAEFEVTVIVGDASVSGYKPNTLDDQVQTHLLPTRFMTVVRERLVTTLGYELTKLWRRSRTVLGAESYATWEQDVYAYYTEDVYEKDENGNDKIILLPDGSLDYNLIHTKGDPQLNLAGEHIKKYLKGQAKVDGYGKPILLSPRKQLREISLLMVDGLFYFGADSESAAYRKEIPMTFVKWIINDIGFLDKQLLEMSKLYLYPTNTFGDTLVTVREGQTTVISIEQSLNVTIYMKQAEFNNPTLRPSLTASIKDVLYEYLSRKVISISDITSKLKEVMGDGVMSIEVNGLGGVNNFSILTVNDDAARLTIKKKLSVLSNQNLLVEDDINFNFMAHNNAQ